MNESPTIDIARPAAARVPASDAIPATTRAVVFDAPQVLGVRDLPLTPPGAGDVVVDVDWSGISTGTERLLWTGKMPPFPGLGYPLVPGYESVGRIAWAGPESGRTVGETVFVPGARCFGDVRGLFGGAASTLTVDGARVIPLPDYPDGRALETAGVLFSLAATAQHAFVGGDLPDLIVGHGVLGRLLARIALAHGASPTVWEIDADRAKGAEGYTVLHPDADGRKDYRAIYDASGAGAQLDAWIGRLAKGGEIVLAGFYDQPLSFTFPPAFMREARFRIAAEFTPEDLATVSRLIAEGRLSLDGLVTHTGPASAADAAYRTAFADPACLKMVLDWRNCS